MMTLLILVLFGSPSWTLGAPTARWPAGTCSAVEAIEWTLRTQLFAACYDDPPTLQLQLCPCRGSGCTEPCRVGEERSDGTIEWHTERCYVYVDCSCTWQEGVQR